MEVVPELTVFEDPFGQRVRTAVLELVAERRVDEVSVEELASRIGAEPEEIYRRWPSKPDLLIRLAYSFMAGMPIPDTGSVRDDLREFTGGWQQRSGTDLGPLIHAVLGELHRSRDALAAWVPVDEFLKRVFVGIMRRGVERGELPEDASVGLAVEMLRSRYSLGYLTNVHLDDRFVDETVDDVVMPILFRTGARDGG